MSDPGPKPSPLPRSDGGPGEAGPPLPAPPKAPSDPALSKVILMATDAVKMDQAGRYKDAKQSYMWAAEELIIVCRASTDPLRQVAYKKRADTYLKRAEAIDRMIRQQAAQRRQTRETHQRANWFLGAFGRELQMPGGANEKKPTQEVLAGKKIVCVFFGANWNPACKAFLLELQKLHTLVNAEHEEEFEVVFASQDRAQKDFDDLQKAVPWYPEPAVLGFARHESRRSIELKIDLTLPVGLASHSLSGRKWGVLQHFASIMETRLAS